MVPHNVDTHNDWELKKKNWIHKYVCSYSLVVVVVGDGGGGGGTEVLQSGRITRISNLILDLIWVSNQSKHYYW